MMQTIVRKVITLTNTLTIVSVFGLLNTNCSPTKFYQSDSQLAALSPIIRVVRQPSDHPMGEEAVLEYVLEDPKNLMDEIHCTVDGVEIPCELKGDTLVWPADSLPIGSHSVKIEVTNDGEFSASVIIDWYTYDGVVPTSFVHNIDSSSVDKNKLDVLFVIDNSGSMSQEQTDMAQRIYNFLDKVDHLDWRVAVTSTDPADDGGLFVFSNTNYFLSKGDVSLADAKDMLSNRIQLGSNGGRYEQGILATYRSIETKDTFNFYRDNVGLSVVLISDEDESDTGFKNKPDELISLVSSTWPQKPFFFNSIIYSSGQNATSCPTGAIKGLRYEELTTKTGGILGSVCSADYSVELEDIGDLSAKVVKTVALSCQPQDINDDGIPELTITGGVVPNYTLSGVNVIFDTELTDGDYQFDYFCPDIP